MAEASSLTEEEVAIVDTLTETTMLVSSIPVHHYSGEVDENPIDLRESRTCAGFWWRSISGLVTDRFDEVLREDHMIQDETGVTHLTVASSHEDLQTRLDVDYYASGTLLVRAGFGVRPTDYIYQEAIGRNSPIDGHQWEALQAFALNKASNS